MSLIKHRNRRISIVMWDRTGDFPGKSLSTAVEYTKNFAPTFYEIYSEDDSKIVLVADSDGLKKGEPEALYQDLIKNGVTLPWDSDRNPTTNWIEEEL